MKSIEKVGIERSKMLGTGSLTVSLNYYARKAAMAYFKVYQDIAKEKSATVICQIKLLLLLCKSFSDCVADMDLTSFGTYPTLLHASPGLHGPQIGSF